MDVNESAHRMAEQALTEIAELQRRSKRLRALIKSLILCRRAGAELPADLVDQMTSALDAFYTDLRNFSEGEA
jgi:hypothetical protein